MAAALTAAVEQAPRVERNPFAGREYRWWWAMAFAGALAAGVQIVTIPTYVLDRTDTDFLVAVAVLCQTVPTALFTLVGGAWADRFGRRRILWATIATMTLAATGLLALSAAGVRAVWPVFPIAAVMGTALAFQNPARQSLINVFAPGTRLQNGVILGTLAFMGGQSFLGPAVGGAAVALGGLSAGFAAAVALLLTSALCATRLPDVSAPGATAGSGMLAQIGAGFRYVFGEPKLWQVLVLGTVPGLFYIGVTQPVFPVFARDTFDRGAAGIAMLNAGMGGGTLIGSLLLARIGPRTGRGRWFLLSLPLGGLAFVIGGMAPSIGVAVALFAVWGLGGALFINYASTLLQTYADPRYLGRVMSIYSLCVMGTVPLGNLHAGLGLELWGPRAVIVYSGLASAMIGCLATVTLKAVRRLD